MPSEPVYYAPSKNKDQELTSPPVYSMYDEIADAYKSSGGRRDIDYGPEIHSTAAATAQKFWTKFTKSDDLKKRLAEGGKAPSNCNFLWVKDVNPEIWARLQINDIRVRDTVMTKVHDLHNAQSSLNLQATSMLFDILQENNLQEDPRVSLAHNKLLSSLQVAGQVSQKFDSIRRANIRPWVKSEYQGVTENVDPQSEYLFGNLPATIELINKQQKTADLLSTYKAPDPKPEFSGYQPPAGNAPSLGKAPQRRFQGKHAQFNPQQKHQNQPTYQNNNNFGQKQPYYNPGNQHEKSQNRNQGQQNQGAQNQDRRRDRYSPDRTTEEQNWKGKR